MTKAKKRFLVGVLEVNSDRGQYSCVRADHGFGVLVEGAESAEKAIRGAYNLPEEKWTVSDLGTLNGQEMYIAEEAGNA